jgi:hypothetical protein
VTSFEVNRATSTSDFAWETFPQVLPQNFRSENEATTSLSFHEADEKETKGRKIKQFFI